ncbi:type II secretion system F family protein [Thermoproteota archaeon]
MIIQLFKSFKKSSLSLRKISYFLDAGISFETALISLIKDEQSPVFKKQLQALHKDISTGRPFLKSIKHILPNWLPFMFSECGITPDIAKLCCRLANYLDIKLNALENTVKQLLYPAVLFTSVLLVLGLLIIHLIPALYSLYSDMNSQIPASLHYMFACSRLIQNNSATILLMIILSSLAAAPIIKQLSIRVMKSVFFPFQCSDLIWILACLSDSGLDLKSVLEAVILEDRNPYKTRFLLVKDDVYATGKFSEGLKKYLKLTSFHYEILKNAEQTASLSNSLTTVSNDMRDNEQANFKLKLNVIQPVALGLLSIVIFFLLYLIFYPISHSINTLI